MGPARTYVNLWIVFFLCGLWHGAAWTFVVWGMWHGVLLVAERWGSQRFGFTLSGSLGNALTFILVLIGWVLFRADSLAAAGRFISHMFGGGTALSHESLSVWFYLTPDIWSCLCVAVFFSWLPMERFKYVRLPEPVSSFAQGSVALVLIIYSAAVLSKSAFNPFIYFRF